MAIYAIYKKIRQGYKTDTKHKNARSPLALCFNFFFKIYKKTILIFCLPFFLSTFFSLKTGNEYNVGVCKKIKLMLQIITNTRKISTASHFLEHLIMATKILNIPESQEGVVIECGCYKGGSTANLSLICALCNRELHVFDSFKGLPSPKQQDKKHFLINLQQIHSYSQYDWCGSFKDVTKKISQYGKIHICNFHVGYFDNTLPLFKKKYVFIFVDVDLAESVQACLKWLWPLLQQDCYLFTHETPHKEIATLFYDKEWWHKELNCNPPQLIGAGTGIGLFPEQSFFGSSLGYTIKNSSVIKFKEIPQGVYT